ncbi:DNA-binding MarR family transcriptional regulator [Lactobacillus colini]|uniref:DNA-binding MarR family transcriptional regulator n=1 Tax=Lactobacillus colini TaxID=1819254 RepID=A0ABS4MCR5_9LACO|nr:MarR family transcriptional regulator [Lactobacillus colini]MBP2057182.1 DNA-binding MarR family transcriptional regulator [Lactobacillus colini]
MKNIKIKPIKMLIKQANVAANNERSRFAKKLGITGTQMSVIDYLSDQDQNTASQHMIEKELDIRRSTTTVLVQGMEKRQLVERIDDPSDKRKKLVQLTPKAAKLVSQIKAYVKSDDQSLRKQFSSEEIAAVEKVLEFIRKEGKNA